MIYPNPVKGPGPVTIQISLTAPAAEVDIQIFTTAFRKINEIQLAQVPAGVTNYSYNLQDRWGRPLANGLYYVVVTVDGKRTVSKLLILK